MSNRKSTYLTEDELIDVFRLHIIAPNITPWEWAAQVGLRASFTDSHNGFMRYHYLRLDVEEMQERIERDSVMHQTLTMDL